MLMITVLARAFRNSYNYQNKYYLLTHTRSAPWVIGVILGYFIFKIKQKELTLKLNRIVVWVMWGVCFGTLLACVLGGHSTLRGEEYDRWGNAFHIALVRPAWSLAICWVILACTNDYGGEKKNNKKIPNHYNCFQRLSTGYYHFLSTKYLIDLRTVST
jgi:hypothetical protein